MKHSIKQENSDGSVIFSDRSSSIGGVGDVYMESPNPQNQHAGRTVAGNGTKDCANRNSARVVHFLFILCCLFSLLSCACQLTGCTAAQKQMFQNGLVSVGDCSLHATIGCVATSMGACTSPLSTFDGDDWSAYASCLATTSSSCSIKGISLCAYRSIVDSLDGAPMIGGGVGCAQMTDKLEECIADARIETEGEAVQVVADCQRRICSGN